MIPDRTNFFNEAGWLRGEYRYLQMQGDKHKSSSQHSPPNSSLADFDPRSSMLFKQGYNWKLSTVSFVFLSSLALGDLHL